MKNCIAPLAALALLFASCAKEPETGPVVNGHHLSFWLRTWVDKSSSQKEQQDAEKSISQAGTNVIPYLLNGR